MIDWLGIPPDFILLMPLALAAGVDLYLVLLLLGVAPQTGLWDSLPGALADLGSPGVLIIAGGFYLMELLAERWPATGLVWNTFHAVIRPLAGALLALLLLDGHPAEVVTLGAVLAGLLASLAHAARTGWGVLLWLDSAAHPNRLLVAILEDVVVVGAVVLLLDAPRWGLVASIVFLLAALRVGGSQVRAFTFAVRLAVSRVWTSLGPSRWEAADDFPEWVRGATEGRMEIPGAGARGYPAGGHRLPGAPLFITGWVVVGGGVPLFLYRRARRSRSVSLESPNGVAVTDRPFLRGVELLGPTPVRLYFGLGGPPAESLNAEFHEGLADGTET